MSKIMVVSDSPWRPSGFGKVANHLLQNFPNSVGWASTHFGKPINYKGSKIYGRFENEHGHDVLERLVKKEKPDFVITLRDVEIQRNYGEIMKRFFDAKWLPYVPIDSLNVHKLMAECLVDADEVVAMSKHGKKKLKEIDVDSTYIPHGVDTDIYKPMKTSMLKMKELEDKFCVFAGGTNQQRKFMGKLIKGYSIFAEDKNDTMLLMHCDRDRVNAAFGGWDIETLFQIYDITDKAMFTDPQKERAWRYGISDKDMAKLYNLSDVGLYAGAEGFGLFTLQHQACGKPVIIGDQTTAKELVGDHGLRVNYKETYITRKGTEFGIPDSEEIARALQTYYDDRKLMKKHGKLSLKHARKYKWENVILEWEKLFSRLKDKGGGYYGV